MTLSTYIDQLGWAFPAGWKAWTRLECQNPASDFHLYTLMSTDQAFFVISTETLKIKKEIFWYMLSSKLDEANNALVSHSHDSQQPYCKSIMCFLANDEIKHAYLQNTGEIRSSTARIRCLSAFEEFCLLNKSYVQCNNWCLFSTAFVNRMCWHRSHRSTTALLCQHGMFQVKVNKQQLTVFKKVYVS